MQTGEGVKPWMMRHGRDTEPEDLLRAGLVCSEQFRGSEDAVTACEDGLCVGCKKPHWSGGRGEVEQLLGRGHTCFLVRDVPQYALAAHVEVVCEDGDCFGCVPRSGGEERRRQQRPRTLEEMMGLGYTCVLTRFAATFMNFFNQNNNIIAVTKTVPIRELCATEGSVSAVRRQEASSSSRSTP